MIGKEKAILIGPFVGEMFWEFFRFVPYVIKIIKKNSNVKVIVYTRPDRYDMYGNYADEFIPLKIKGDAITRYAECFRIMDMKSEEYEKLAFNFREKYRRKYKIISHLYPDIRSKKTYLNKDLYPLNLRDFDYSPRKENTKLVNKFLKDVTKKIIIVAPRYRANFKRNWPHWEIFYDIIKQDKFFNKYEIIICGKKREYVPDKKGRFKDINQIKLGENSSLIGVLMSLMKRSFMTVGSQSAIPNISLLFGVPAVEWGNQKFKHTVSYNILKTKVLFIEDNDFVVPVKKVIQTLKSLEGEL